MRKLTYAQVRQDTRRLACEIAARVPCGRAVAVLVPNSPTYVISALACLAAGRCCLVLNAEHPPERIAAILRESGTHSVIVTDSGCAESPLIPDGVARIAIADLSDAVAAESWRPSPLGSDQPAIVLYTSGSTGRPKGVVFSQAMILSRARNRIAALSGTMALRFPPARSGSLWCAVATWRWVNWIAEAAFRGGRDPIRAIPNYVSCQRAISCVWERTACSELSAGATAK